MDLDFSPYATGGAQARSDSFTRLDPNFATGVYGLTQAAHAAGIPLQITSAYRSPELQAQLYASALERYGSPQAARRWVAPPGRSQHNYGTAVDFALNGSLIRDADSPAAQFIRNNAAQYGLSVPMSWEPWQVEPVGSRDGSRPNAPTNTQTTGVGMDDTPQQPSGELSRSQRMMLGFAALRDAGAALQGQNSNFFADTMGGIQQQAQAADDRAFRQMQFDEGVRQFGVQQAGAAEQRGLLTAQEQRLLDERNQQTRMTALQGIAALDVQDERARAVAAASGRPYTPSAASVAMRQAFMGQLTNAGGTLGDPAAGTPAGGTPPIVPAAGGTPPIVPAAGVPAMTVDAAAAVIDNPASSAQEIADARTYLERLPAPVAEAIGQGRIDALLERSGGAIETAQEAEAAAEAGASLAASFENYGGQVVDYLIAQEDGRPVFDQNGNPVFNPMVASRAGRFIAGTLETPEYQKFRGALDFIANNLTFDKMAAMKAAGITFGSLSNAELEQVAATATTLNIDDPIGTYNALLQIERDYNIDLGLGGAAAGGGSFESGGLTFEEVK